jgi:predicted RNA-binding Zn-ribbon protein involved in translation (DUF1610 family)
LSLMPSTPPGLLRRETPKDPLELVGEAELIRLLRVAIDEKARPIPMLLWCPMCGARHIDEGEFATKVHHTHSCQSCGMTWRPAVVATVGVQFLPGFRNETPR